MLTIFKKVKYLFNYASWERRFLITMDKLAGVDFYKDEDPENVGLTSSHFRYSASRKKDVQNIFDHLMISKGDNIIDVGCGKGNALRLLLEYPFSKVDGIELSEKLTTIAKNNFRKLKISDERCHVFCMDGADFKDFDSYNYIYLYNPFPCAVMEIVMQNLIESIKKQPRKVTIIYGNAFCNDEILSTGMFTKTAEYPEYSNHNFIQYSNQI